MRRADLERLARLVGVDVDLERFGIADDEQRVAELEQLGLDRVVVEVLAFDHEHGAVAVLRQLLVNRVDVQLLALRRRFRQLLACGRRCETADDLEQADAAGIDDARFAEDRELLRRARDRLLAAADEPGEQLVDVVPVEALALLRHFADDGEHRPFDRLPHGAVGSVAGRLERTGDDAGVDRRRSAERLGRTADDLREDHAGVPARTHQRGARDLLDEGRAILGRRLLEPVDDRPCGQREVRAGVAVGHGIDVEVVDPLAVAFERRERAAGKLENPGEVAHALDLLTSWMRTSTCATGRPVSRSTSYWTRFCSVDATSARFRPYSMTTWSSMVTPSPALPPTVIPWRKRSRVSSRSRGLRGAMPTTP